MSLINEALKKAQRLHTEEAVDTDTTTHGGAQGGKRGQVQSANTMVLLASGALVLVVLSVVFTVYLVNRPTKPAAAVATSTPVPAVPSASASSTTSETAAPAIVAPKIAPATAATTEVAPAGATPPATSTPATPNAASQPVASAAAVPTSPEPATVPSAAPALAPGAPDERVVAFVEAIRVTGIRSSGAESRVLMNERVYRVNDIVERTLGVRLIKAAADSLTFSDSRGVTYTKNF